RRLGYVAWKFVNWHKQVFHAVVDGGVGPAYDDIGPLVFSPDGRRMAYRVKQEKVCGVVVDGREMWRPGDRGLGDPIFSPDSRRVAYLAADGSTIRAIVDGMEGKRYESLEALAFSPDSRHLALGARIRKKWHLVVDDEQGPEYIPAGAVF